MESINTTNIQTQYWEVPEIDLNLRHYSGHPSDVIKIIKTSIEQYLSNPEVPLDKRQIYSAIYHSLTYYKNISYLPGADFETGETFLSNCINSFNNDYDYLAQKYNSTNPLISPVINYSGRIKSPLSFLEKVREKITNYLKEGRDLGYFNESLRDLIGIRCIIDPPEHIKAQGKEAESDFLYTVFYDLMSKRGILQENPESDIYKFIPVNTRFHPHKSEEIKSRIEREGFCKEISSISNHIFIPQNRPEEINNPIVDSVLKDYNLYPKKSGYQSLHTCIIPSFSKNIEPMPIPSYIIPTKSNKYYFEYQFRLLDQDNFAEYGFASHNSTYKPSGPYHRLCVPFYIAFDSLEDYTEDLYEPKRQKTNSKPYKNKLRLRNFGESYKKFYGNSFESFFGISFKKFRDVFTFQERNDILARKKVVVYDETKDLYKAVDNTPDSQSPIILSLTSNEIQKLKEILSSDNIEKFSEFLDNHYLKDAIIEVLDDSSEASNSPNIPAIKLYSFHELKEEIQKGNIPPTERNLDDD